MADPASWARVASDIPLACSLVSEGSMLGTSFASFRREISEPAMPDPKTTPWMHGTRNGINVVVRPLSMREAAIENPYDPHSRYVQLLAEPSVRAAVAPFTSSIAEISPAMFAGVRMVTRGSARFGSPFTHLLRVPNHAGLAAAYWTNVFDANRLAAVLIQGPSDPFPDALVDASRDATIAIHDDMSEVIAKGDDLDARTVSSLVERAASLAAEFSRRARELPDRPEEVALRNAWAAYAATYGLAFDAARWCIHGERGGVAFEVLLEAWPAAIVTTARAFFPRPLGCGLYIRPDRDPPLLGIFLRTKAELRVGGSGVHDALFVEALDHDRARQALAPKEVREALRELRHETEDILVTDRDVVAACMGGLGSHELGALVQRVVTVADTIAKTGERGARSPYR